MLIITFISISISLAYLADKPITSFHRIICYESFSKPKILLPLHIHEFTGPQYINIDFKMDIQYSKSSKIENYWHKSLYFKNVNRSCHYSNVAFGPNLMKYYKLYISIEIYLPKQPIELSFIKYTFYEGFKPDNYTLVDQYGNFAIPAKFTDYIETSPRDVVGDEEKAYMYLKTLKYQGNNICFVTVNNRQNAIKPIFFKVNKRRGYLIGITAQVTSYNDYFIYQFYEYPAYECYVPERYIRYTYFILEKDEQLNLYVNTTRINEENKLVSQVEVFFTHGYTAKLTEKMLYRGVFNLVFLMKQDYIKCENHAKRKGYISKNNTLLYVHYLFNFEIMPKIKRYQWLSYDILNPCE